ncbi:MAG: S1/P1 nuclease [Aquabacterium sp.]|nr:S1/P1 nuclease [Aquabacterium sp.]
MLAAPAWAWGPRGHQTVGGIADQLIAGTPTARKVRAMLGTSLQVASVWADCARAVESKAGQWAYTNPGKFKDCAVYENAASQAALVAFVKRNATRCGFMASHAQCRHKAWHFTDIPIQLKAYGTDLPGAAPHDLVQAVAASITVLQGGKPPPAFNIASKREALRLLAHFVGDLHQPLHVGSVYLTDDGKPMLPKTDAEAKAHDNAGGNGILLAKSNLHALWDDVPGKITTRLLAGAGATQARNLAATSGPIADWPARWATDTLQAAPLAFQGLTIGAKLHSGTGDQWPATAEEPAYRRARENLQAAQMVKAGARLAQILTTVLP